MATYLEDSEKLARIDNVYANTFHLVKKIVKIGPVDPEIPLFNLKKKEINASKMYSPVVYLINRSDSLRPGEWNVRGSERIVYYGKIDKFT